MSRLVLLVAIAAVPDLGQVHVDLRTSQERYLAGEPIFVVADVTNIGTDPIGYSYCDGRAELVVPGGQRRQWPKLHGGSTGRSGGSGCSLDHPPMMKPGQLITFWYLLKGYNLRAGEYVLHASGKAGVTEGVEAAKLAHSRSRS